MLLAFQSLMCCHFSLNSHSWKLGLSMDRIEIFSQNNFHYYKSPTGLSTYFQRNWQFPEDTLAAWIRISSCTMARQNPYYICCFHEKRDLCKCYHFCRAWKSFPPRYRTKTSWKQFHEVRERSKSSESFQCLIPFRTYPVKLDAFPTQLEVSGKLGWRYWFCLCVWFVWIILVLPGR